LEKKPVLASTAGWSLASIRRPFFSWYFFRLPDQCSVAEGANTETNTSLMLVVRLKALTGAVGVEKVVASSRMS
jgi:hypothetical protein